MSTSSRSTIEASSFDHARANGWNRRNLAIHMGRSDWPFCRPMADLCPLLLEQSMRVLFRVGI